MYVYKYRKYYKMLLKILVMLILTPILHYEYVLNIVSTKQTINLYSLHNINNTVEE